MSTDAPQPNANEKKPNRSGAVEKYNPYAACRRK